MSLADLLKKWDDIPLKQVEQEAEKGNPMAQHYLGYCYMEGHNIARDTETGANWYQRALTNGYLPSANNLGFAYQRGLLGSNDLNRAIYYYTYASDRGLDQAQFDLGVLYRDGKGVQRDPVEAMRLFRLASVQGHLAATVEIGRLYRFGQGVATNLSEAEELFQKAADRGSSLGQLNLGLLYEDGGRQGEALQFYQRAANQGQTDAMTKLYCCYWDGIGVVPDHAKAMQWLTKAAESGNPWAQNLMGYRYENPDQGNAPASHPTNPNLIEAFKWYRRSAEQNWANSQYHLGLFYLEGRVVELDEERGLELERTAADKGSNDATIELASLYARGTGEPRGEQDRPMQLLERAGALGDLIFRYEYGLGTKRDMVAVAKCYCHASTNESLYYSPDWLANKIEFKPTKRVLGMSMAYGDGHVQIYGPLQESSSEPTDEALRFLSLYLKSALGDSQSALEIANCYLAGQDVPGSMTNAWIWFTLAAQNGSTAAPAKLTEIESRMSADELTKAKRQLPDLIRELNPVAASVRIYEGGLNSNP